MAFSLVEVCLAIGVTSFAFLGVFALLPAGLGLFRQAIDTSVSAQIVQRIAGDAQQTDFDTLTGYAANNGFYFLPMRYFDDQGSEVKVVDPAAPTPTEFSKILYWVRVRGSVPGDPNPANHTNTSFTSLPTTGAQRFNPRATTFLTVQIMSNPARIDYNALLNSSNLIDANSARAVNLPLQTYSIVISRNGYAKAP